MFQVVFHFEEGGEVKIFAAANENLLEVARKANVAIDAPCSGTGVMTEKPDVKYRVTAEGVQSLCFTQAAILDAVAPMVKVGGTLVYSTCSILPQENEEQIKLFLARHPEYEVLRMGAELPEKLAAHEGEYGLQMFAHRDGTDGFYVCRLRRVKA